MLDLPVLGSPMKMLIRRQGKASSFMDLNRLMWRLLIMV
jgi:hypothetical protein